MDIPAFEPKPEPQVPQVQPSINVGLPPSDPIQTPPVPPPPTPPLAPVSPPPSNTSKTSNKKLLLSAGIFVVTIGIFMMALLLRKQLFTTQNDAATSSCVLQDSNIVLVIDRSSSMTSKESDGRTKLEWAKQSAKTLVDRIAAMPGTTAKISVVSFGAQGNDGTGKLGSNYNSTLHIALSSNYASVKTAIDGIQNVTSGTCIECGIRIANEQLTAQALNRVVILLSDGKANHNWAGESANGTGAINEANKGRAAGLVYYVLGYGTGSGIDEPTLKSIAGKDANYQYKPNAQEWPDAFLTIVDIICQQPTPTPSVTPTKAPSPTPKPTFTVTPTPSPTITPTPIPNATITPTPSPTPCLKPSPVTNLKISCPLCQ